MNHIASIIQEEPDGDTLGGRIWRARDALDITAAELARRLGVRTETLTAWESDRSEPRANRLIMLAGVLGVSPTWLLSGVGDAPATQTLDSGIEVVAQQLCRLRDQHAETATMIDALESELTLLARRMNE